MHLPDLHLYTSSEQAGHSRIDL